MSISFDKTIANALMGLIVFTALAHGIVEHWSALVFELWTIALLLLWVIKALAEKELSLVIPQTALPLAALIVVGAVQGFAGIEADGVRRSLSFDVEATRGAVMMLCCLLVCCVVAANFLTTRDRLERFAGFMTVYGLVMALFAIVQHFTWNEHFYWLRAVQTETPFGSFVNRNHFAGYMEFLLPWPVALMLVQRRDRGGQIFLGCAAAWMGAAAVLSLSRGGMISILAELMLLAGLSMRGVLKYRIERVGSRVGAIVARGGIVAVIMAAIIGGVLWLGAEQVIDRLATGHEVEQSPAAAKGISGSRSEIWRDSWAVFRANPLTGVGLGAFGTALPIYGQDSGLGRTVAQAHNDYLQILTDGGIIGGAIALWFVILVFRAVARGTQSRDPLSNAVALACGAGIFGLLVHSLFDFNLQLPSHALLFLTLASIEWSVGEEVGVPVMDYVESSDIVAEEVSWAQRNRL